MKNILILLLLCTLSNIAWSQSLKEIEDKLKETPVKSALGDEGLLVNFGTSVTSEGNIVVGNPAGNYLAFDFDDIQSKSGNGALYDHTLYLNFYGGNVNIARGVTGISNTTIGANNDGLLSAYNTLYVKGDSNQVGIGTSLPTEKLEITGGGIKINTETSTPAPNTLYGNSMPIAWGLITGGGVLGDSHYGVVSVIRTATGRYTIETDNNFQLGNPVFAANQFDIQTVGFISYFPSNTNTFLVRTTDQNGTDTDRAFSFVIFGNPQ